VLNVEHVQEDDEDFPVVSDMVPVPAKTQTKVEVYDLVADRQSELAFQVFCFFED